MDSLPSFRPLCLYVRAFARFVCLKGLRASRSQLVPYSFAATHMMIVFRNVFVPRTALDVNYRQLNQQTDAISLLICAGRILLFLIPIPFTIRSLCILPLVIDFWEKPWSCKIQKKQLIVINSIWSGFFEKNRKYRIEFTTFVDVDNQHQQNLLYMRINRFARFEVCVQ